MAVALVSGVGIWLLVLTRDRSLTFEDLRLIGLGTTPDGYLRPYAGHLSVVPIALYQVYARVFGLASPRPLQVLAEFCIAMVALSLFGYMRKRAGNAVALVVVTTMAAFPHQAMIVSAFNHHLAFVGIVACAWLLSEHPDRHHGWLAAALAFSLCSSGASVAGAAGCVAYLALTHPAWKRWLAVLVPLAGWAVWRLAVASSTQSVGGIGISEGSHRVITGVVSSFRYLALGNALLGWLLIGLFVGELVWQASVGLARVASQMSWTVALGVWWIGLVVSRPDALRHQAAFGPFLGHYEFIGAGFIILAMTPGRPLHLPARPTAFVRLAGGAACVALACAVPFFNAAGIRATQRSVDALQPSTDRDFVYANLGPDKVSNDAFLQSQLVKPLSAGDLRELADRFGTPSRARTDDPIRWLIDDGVFTATITAGSAHQVCVPRTFIASMDYGSSILVQTGARPVDLEARVGDGRWVKIVTVPARSKARLVRTDSPAQVVWQILTTNACAG